MTGSSTQGRAESLMRNALSMLDDTRHAVAAAHLQAAIDALMPVAPDERNGNEKQEGRLVTDPVFVRAIGGVLAVLGALLQRKGIVSIKEFANILGIYAVATAEEADDEEGLILGALAAMLRDVGPLCESQLPPEN